MQQPTPKPRVAPLILPAILAAPAAATPFAVEVVGYDPGTLPAALADYQDPAAALGKTRQTTPAFGDDVPPSVVTPFNATYTPDDLVAIGEGGRLVLRLDRAALTAGLGLGVHAGVGLIDTAFPAGDAGPVATPYTSPRVADVAVSADGATFTRIADSRVFDVPTNWYAGGVTTPGADPGPGTVPADFARPFAGDLSDFDGLDWDGVLALLDGSAGGEWLDLSGVAADSVAFVEFTVDQPGGVMLLDAVATVPEPSALLSLLALPAALLLRRRR